MDGDRVRGGITGAFGVPGENENGRRVVEFYAERGVCVCVDNTYFEHKSLHKYTRGQDGVEVKSMTDLMMVKKDMLRFVQDMRTVRGNSKGNCKVRLVRTWIKSREVGDGARRIRREKLKEHQYREGYARSLEGKRVEWDGENSVDHMWE